MMMQTLGGLSVSVCLPRDLRSFVGVLAVAVCCLPSGAAFGGGDKAAPSKPLSLEDMFSEDRPLEIEITLPKADWDTLRLQSRTFASALKKELQPKPFTYFRADVVINGRRFKEVGVRKKGFIGSLDEERPSLKVKFNEYRQHGRIGGLDRLTLNNNKQDKSLASQYLSYRLYRAAGVPAPRTSYARVTVNGTYLGIYTNVESVKKPFLKHNFSSSKGNLYEGTLADFFPDRIARFELKNNRSRKQPRAELMRLAKMLEGSDKLPLDQIKQQLDYDQFLSFWATESLIGFWDGYGANQNNFFVYQRPKDGKLEFIPWGADSAFSISPFFFFQVGPKSVHAQGRLANRLYREPTVAADYRQRLLKLLDTIWKEQELLASLDRIKEKFASQLHSRQKGFTLELRKLAAFIKSRREVLMGEMEAGPVALKSKARRPMYVKPVGTLRANFDIKWASAVMRQNSPGFQLQVDVEGESLPLKSADVASRLGTRFGPADRTEARPPTIVIRYQRKADGKTLTAQIHFSPDHFRGPQETPVLVQGSLTEPGNGFFGLGGRMLMLTGEAQLRAAGQKKGDRVAGELDVEILEMRGGFMGRRRGKAKSGAKGGR